MERLGPLQSADAETIKALIKMIDAKVVVEFGYLFGDSAKTILEALGEDGKLFSYDIEARHIKTHDSRFTFVHKSQANFESIGDKIDFVFFDASHDLELNKITFEKILPELSDKAIIAVHDTGTWPYIVEDTGGYEINGEYLHRPDERKFVNWIRDTYPDFDQLHFHTLSKVRHGLTIIKKYQRLAI